MAESTNNKVPSEEELGEKWDRCVADTILKTGGAKKYCVKKRERGITIPNNASLWCFGGGRQPLGRGWGDA